MLYPFPFEQMPDGRYAADGEKIDEALAELARSRGWMRNGGQWRGPGAHDLLPHL